MSKIIVGLSGGVDSAVTAYLLKAAGHDVIGVTLKTWIGGNGELSRCCEIDDARRISYKLDIPYYAVNCAGEFRENVIEPFIHSYINGMTPNPCVVCNTALKWDRMLEFADSQNADYIATGHYASVVRLENGRYTVRNADYAEKDQTYMLYRLTQKQLSRTIMPLGKLSKNEVRAIAASANLPVANKPDSQEICFVTSGSYADFILDNTDDYTPQEGNFVDENGNILGRHKGIINYTVGQRKGLGIALGRPMYVKFIDAEKNEVVLCDDTSLYTDTVFCNKPVFQSIENIEKGQSIRASARIRYRHKAQAAVITRISDDQLKIDFDKPVRAPAPGQSAVIYNENGCVVGGGVIINNRGQK